MDIKKSSKEACEKIGKGLAPVALELLEKVEEPLKESGVKAVNVLIEVAKNGLTTAWKDKKEKIVDKLSKEKSNDQKEQGEDS